MLFLDNLMKCILLLILVVALGCDEDTSDTVISQFENPKDVALVCFDSAKKETLPLDCCGDALDEGKCPYGISTAELYAFVTQTTPGEVAVVDLENRKIVDQAGNIPYNSFIPVGGQPNDIAATTDGSKVYTVNYETGDMSIIHVVDKEKDLIVVEDPYLSPANSIDLDGPAARLALVKYPEKYEDKVALVTQPTLGRLTILALDPEECEEPERQVDGCVKAYLTIKTEVKNEDSGEMEEVKFEPYAITSADGQSVYLGSYNAPAIVDIQLESLVAEALAMETPGEIDQKKVVNEIISIYPYKARSLSIEPKKRRWIYGIEAEKGGVIAMDLTDRIPGSKEPMKIKEVSVRGIAQAVKVLELQESDEYDPYTFNGTFAIVTTSKAGLAVIDIEDNDVQTAYFRRHNVRSRVDMTGEDGIPEIEDAPSLTIDKEKIDEAKVDSYVYFSEGDAGVECDGGDGFKASYDNGVQFRCDPYQSREQKWSLMWRGPIGLSGVGIITNITEKNSDRWKLLNEDSRKDFCASELYTRNTEEGYKGDRLIITSDPTPTEGNESLCDEMYDSDVNPEYRVVGVSKYLETDEKPNVIEFEKSGPNSVELIPECYGQTVDFEIRADDHWTIRGSSSSYSRRQGTFSPEESACNYDDSPQSELRVYPKQKYENSYIKFTMKYGEKWDIGGPQKLEMDEEDKDPSVEATYEFQVTGGYEEMFTAIGAINITDIEMSPDDELMLIDQGGEGLILFDLLDDFTTIGSHIN